MLKKRSLWQPKSSERFFNTGEGGLHPGLTDFTDYAAVQVASGRFGVHKQYLNNCRFIEIKIGQGAKPGIGGHLPGEKVTVEVSNARMIPSGSDAISPAPHHDIYSIEDLRQLIWSLKEATQYKKNRCGENSRRTQLLGDSFRRCARRCRYNSYGRFPRRNRSGAHENKG